MLSLHGRGGEGSLTQDRHVEFYRFYALPICYSSFVKVLSLGRPASISVSLFLPEIHSLIGTVSQCRQLIWKGRSTAGYLRCCTSPSWSSNPYRLLR